jgi:branched-chain amino acid transport system ATP-binding protein
MAGLGPEESTRMVALLGKLKTDFTILLIEHDMDAVFALADRITVLLSGRVVATDVPTSIRANEEVQEAYLGSQEP